MFFSILIPVYNTSEYLPECMDSVLSQSFHDFEVVLLDDGSTDNSGQLCDEYAQKDDRVRVIHKQNEGLMMTRRRGFKEAKGDYFICVDSDDKLYDNCALEKVHDLIKESDCDMVIYNYVYGAGGNRVENTREVFALPDGYIFENDQKKLLYEKLLTTSYMNNIWIKCSARSIVDIDTDYSVWKEEICRAEDLFQSFPLLDNAQRIGYIKDPLYYYRWSPNSISNNIRVTYYYAFRCIDKRTDTYIQKWNLPESVTKVALRRRVVSISDVICSSYYTCKKNGDLSTWKSFILDISEDPYYKNLLSGCDSQKILTYYKLLHSLIIKKRIKNTIMLIESVSAISKFKRNIKK